jgi:hypothetical protein
MIWRWFMMVSSARFDRGSLDHNGAESPKRARVMTTYPEQSPPGRHKIARQFRSNDVLPIAQRREQR